MRGVRIARDPHRRDRERSVRAGHDIAVVVAGVRFRVARVFTRRVFPAPIGCRGVGEHERSECAAREAQDDRGRVLDGKVACRIRRERLDGDDLAAQRAQVVDLVDHVDQQRAAAGLPPPRRLVEVAVRLAEHRAAHHGDQRSQRAARDDFVRPRHDRAVASMVPDEQPCARALGSVAQRDARSDRMRDWLFDQRRHTGRDAFEGLRRVQRVGRRENDAVDPRPGEQIPQRRVQRHLRPGGDRRRPRRGIRDGRELAGRARRDQFDVPAPDEARAGNRDAQPLHPRTPAVASARSLTPRT